jgi:hypothetical protein
MSALPLKADIVGWPRQVRFVSNAGSRGFLFDHLVGESEQVWRQFETD